MIYLDNAATTRPFDEVLLEMNRVNTDFFANPSSMHGAGYMAEKKINEAVKTVLSAIGGANGSFVFTSGGTESNNLAFFGILQNALKRKPHIITTKIEHPSVLEPVGYLEALGAEVTYIDVDDKGFADPKAVAEHVKENTKLVSVMLVNNETGAIQPIAEMARLVKAKNPQVLFHSDCVQAMGAVPIHAEKLGVDMLSLSGHKINGPKGVGGLYVSKKVRLKPVMLGGHQQQDLRSGTLNTPGICGLAKAMALTVNRLLEKTETLTALKQRLMENLLDTPLFSVNNQEGNYSPHIISLRVKNVRAEVLLHALEAHGVCVSAGSACSSSKPSPSHVLTAMGYEKNHIGETLRISTGAFTTEEEIDTFCALIKKEALQLSKFTRS